MPRMVHVGFRLAQPNITERFEPKYGFFRPVIREVVRNYLTCGDLKKGFARVRCGDCSKEYLLAFSCKGRWFCPSCHAKRLSSSETSYMRLSSIQSPIGTMSSAFPLCCASILNMTGHCSQNCANAHIITSLSSYKT